MIAVVVQPKNMMARVPLNHPAATLSRCRRCFKPVTHGRAVAFNRFRARSISRAWPVRHLDRKSLAATARSCGDTSSTYVPAVLEPAPSPARRVRDPRRRNSSAGRQRQAGVGVERGGWRVAEVERHHRLGSRDGALRHRRPESPGALPNGQLEQRREGDDEDLSGPRRRRRQIAEPSVVALTRPGATDAAFLGVTCRQSRRPPHDDDARCPFLGDDARKNRGSTVSPVRA